MLHASTPGVFTGNVQTVTGPAFDSPTWDATTVARSVVGTLTVTFSDADNGVIDYTVLGSTQSKPITRQKFATPVPVCVYSAQPDLAQTTNLQDLWWAVNPESGWGVNFTHQGNVIVLTWFTYDADGKGLWMIAVLTLQPSGAYEGPLRTVTGPPFNAVPFDPNQVVRTTVGTATVTVTDGNQATFTYTVGDVTQSKPITRQLFAPPAATTCQ